MHVDEAVVVDFRSHLICRKYPSISSKPLRVRSRLVENSTDLLHLRGFAFARCQLEKCETLKIFPRLQTTVPCKQRQAGEISHRYTFCTCIVSTGPGCSWLNLSPRKLLKGLSISCSNSRAISRSCFAVQDSLLASAFNPVRTEPDFRDPVFTTSESRTPILAERRSLSVLKALITISKPS